MVEKVCEWLRQGDEGHAPASNATEEAAFDKADRIAAYSNSSELRSGLRAAALRLSLIYWTCMFFADSALGHFIGIDPLESAALKFVLFSAGAAMTFIMSHLLFRLRELSFTNKALLGFVMTGIAAPLLTAIDYVNYVICEYPKPVPFDRVYSGYMLIECASMLFGWCCLFMALLYSFEVRDRERRLAAVREEALSAQMKALRYQVNPHFLFNTLNSIAGLIEEGATTQAQRMVLSLSSFLRTTLSLDPMHDVPLSDEIALQKEYLGIERERFSDRMAFTIDMDREAGRALVPSLILQPLIENAIKHGVGRLKGNVAISLRAHREADRLRIDIENDMPADDIRTRPPGTGLGLRNVADRLRTRFQSEAILRSGLVDARRFRVSIELPWRPA